MVCVNPFAQVKRAEAIAPVVAGAGAALAAELGISVEGLYLGTAALIAGVTGYCVTSDSFNNMSGDLKTQWDRLFEPGADLGDMTDDRNFWDGYSNGDLSPAGSKTWDELNTDEKSKYGTPAAYTLGCWDGLEMELGLLQENGNGGMEPTPTPDGGGPLQKLKNALTVLGVTGAAVAIDDASAALLNSLEPFSISDFLFGKKNDDSTYGLGLQYQSTVTVDDVQVQIVSLNYRATGYDGGNYTIMPTDWLGYRFGGSDYFNLLSWYDNVTNKVYTMSNADVVFTKVTDAYVASITKSAKLNLANGVIRSDVWGQQYTLRTATMALNSNYAGRYIFPNGNEYSAGTWLWPVEQNANYGQLVQTPQEIVNNIYEPDSLQQWFNEYVNDDMVKGEKRAVTVPLSWGDTAIDPKYDTFVKATPETEIFPTPQDKPVTPPTVGPVVTPPVTPDGYGDDFAAMTNKLLQGPFDQLFPFCLIADFRDFVFIILSGGTVQTTRLHPNDLSTQSDTPVDQLNGVHTLRLDFSAAMEDFVTEVPLDPLHELLGYTRFTLTCVLIMFIVYQSFGFFLKRGA